eukprot:TRINITY_DN20293_c0_g1_i2.p1 TRINITY_DN20293_c0_g1~~TRINITY_DN20293_c0_g1_i2.p1  ORF type:complete len:315 (-),score=17.73 TRINITY_DN20293_c0_g1_i2:500-1444(-)
MTKTDMSRRCSHCGHNGHYSRTCPDRGLKLFGVRISTDGNIRKSVSMGNLLASHRSSTPEASESAGDGYVSDGLVQTSNARERKKGVPWTEEEHKLFLVGLQKLGKGDWRGISRNFVTSRTPTQVASHAQKYFLRQTNLNKRKRRSSLFDIPVDVKQLEEPRRRTIPDRGAGSPAAAASSGTFTETAGSAANIGVPLVPSFAVPESKFIYSSCLSLGRPNATDGYPGAQGSPTAYLKISDFPDQTIPHQQSQETIPDLGSRNSLNGANKLENKEEAENEGMEESGLSLSIAPPCVESDSPHSGFGPKSSAISVV